MSLSELSEYIRVSKYSKFIPELGRRETWDEQVDRMFSTHEMKYGDKLDSFRELYEETKQAVKDKKVVGSQRMLQFGGAPVIKHELRGFNCLFSYINRPRFFQDYCYSLLAGCGVGFSVQTHHVDMLSPIISLHQDIAKTFQIPDSIEGWSDAIGVLISAYMTGEVPFPEYQGFGSNVEFDYSLIRPEGSPISSGRKAPGPAPLRMAIELSREILIQAMGRKLRPIEAYDIAMHIANAVISGGVRRSATIALFSKEDEEMAQAKTGNWFEENPQRGRSNNSAVLVRDETSFEDFMKCFENTKQFGEPGFLFVKSKENGTNPCQPANATLLTPNGISTMGQIKEGDLIWSQQGWTRVIKKWSTGIKEVYSFNTPAGSFLGTENHRVLCEEKKIEVKDSYGIDTLTGPVGLVNEIDQSFVIDGLVLGDGTVHRASNNLVLLCIGEKDKDYFLDPVSSFLKDRREGIGPYTYEINTRITAEELPHTYARVIPDRYFYAGEQEKCSFLRGLFSANGSVVANRITYKTASALLVKQLQIMLSSIGILSYITTNKSKKVEFSNGIYSCKESYDLNISRDKNIFLRRIGFIQEYKNTKLKLISNIQSSSYKYIYEITSREYIDKEEVFDIMVDNTSHTYWTGGVNVSNCNEIGLYPTIELDGKTEYGFAACNLSEINGKYSKTPEDFYNQCKWATVLGTLQAGYTNFPYMGRVTEEIIRREALLGVSITGIMDRPHILLDPEILQKGAQFCREVNELVATKLGINPAARITCVKPSGSASLLLETASGVHPHHAIRYFRRVQANRNEPFLKFYKQANPRAVEQSVWDPNNVTEVITFPCQVPKGARVKNQLTALQFLEQIKLVQENWVLPGTTPQRGAAVGINHNVSNTVNVAPHEWDDVARYIYDNKEYFTGISLLPTSGDKDYPQAPLAAVPYPSEMSQEYGPAAMFASGVIESAMSAFNNNLWDACAKYLSTKEGNLEQQAWFAKADRFAGRYFDNDKTKMVSCLKDCYNLKLWEDLVREHRSIDWNAIPDDDGDVNYAGDAACAGGACQVPPEWLEAMAKLKEENANKT